MAHTKLTARKSTCRFLPPRVHERGLVSAYRDAYQAWKRHCDEAVRQQVADGIQDEPEDEPEEDPEEVEQMEAGISDAARQAYYRYRQELWEEIRDRPERYHPRRESGATACTIASTAGIANRQFASTVALVAVLNTDLDAVSEENYLLRTRITALEDRVEELESLVPGTPAPRSPEYRAESPPRKRARFGTAEARTTVEDP
ncbi:unnamed protein product [Urochloa humidicola]